ncbi:MAG: SDR family NAD(P)-dependent oxidoreductase, partial [Gammaproteobacteria bacterium]|nr:SDR family NAD(P)-dependent oxidoreductase [Gammaproteobacteria bacterium]
MINYQLDNKKAMVTGGASGIGLACVELLAYSGADVAIWDLHEEALEKAKQSISKYNVKCITIKVDVSDPESVKAAMAETVKQLG